MTNKEKKTKAHKVSVKLINKLKFGLFLMYVQMSFSVIKLSL